ncbi:acyl-ACP desaturase [Nocardia sp. CDC153]|uniref:acyl-ACP desaturase n=1 Tax=Nocardia sp. CDC153 TaxID=3112167 RepID=UPI002DBE99D6|nr:acyl-ACP desaturase [Nocardia sp. CDC153]MEC3955956.1 acyl-ACP desaturase [Nocardia sp. CDC153]
MTMEQSLLPVNELVAAVDGFLAASPAARAWDVETAFDWAAADAGRLTDGQRSAVRFVTFIEDHLPGYFDVYQRFFPVDDSVELPAFIHNRELYHFTVRWALEEDTHARALNHYQVASGIAERESLRTELAIEGQKPFDLPYEHPVQFFTYALVQEKATQMYYHQLRDVSGDPVLAAVLSRLARDEARHFSFMADVVSRYLRVQGDDVVEPIRDVIANFRMPLADTMRGYWRWALRIADVADYDHTAAYEHLLKVLDRAVDARTDRMGELAEFIGQCRALA